MLYEILHNWTVRYICFVYLTHVTFFSEHNWMKAKKKQRPIQRRKVLNLCTIFRLAKPAFFRCNGKLHWKGFICSDCGILHNTGNT